MNWLQHSCLHMSGSLRLHNNKVCNVIVSIS